LQVRPASGGLRIKFTPAPLAERYVASIVLSDGEGIRAQHALSVRHVGVCGGGAKLPERSVLDLAHALGAHA
jgi:hypothetical protein